jgi:hypothetical protein
MNRDELVKFIKDSYQKGYREGFTDACNLMRDATTGLVRSMEKGLSSHVIAVDEMETKE